MPNKLKRERGMGNPPPPKPPPPHDIPPHILKELLDLREKVGKLEGMMEVLLKQNKS